MREMDMDSICEVYKDPRQIDEMLRRRLSELNPGKHIRDGYYVLYDSIFNGDHVRLGKWNACSYWDAYKEFCRAVEDPNDSNVRMVKIDFERDSDGE